MSDGGVHYLVYPRQWKAIFGACVVEVSVINIYSPLSFLLRDYHYICQPLWILNFPNKPNCQ